MRVIEKITITKADNDASAYSSVFTAPPMATYYVMSAQRTSGSNNLTVHILGGWDRTSSDAADWVDVGFSCSLNNGNLTKATGGAYDALRTNFAYYKARIDVNHPATVDIYVQFVHH